MPASTNLSQNPGLWDEAVRRALSLQMQQAITAVAGTFLNEEESAEWADEEVRFLGDFLNVLASEDLLRITMQGRVAIQLEYAISAARNSRKTPCGAIELMGTVWQELQA